MERIAKVVSVTVGAPDRDATYWRGRPAAERLAALEHLRRRHHGWDDGARPELQRVHRVVVSGRTQDLADLEALDDPEA